MNKDVEKQNEQKVKVTSKVQTKQKEIKQLNQTLVELPNAKVKISDFNKKLNDSNTELKTYVSKIDKSNDSIKLIESEIEDLTQVLKGVSNGVFPTKYDVYFEEFFKLLSKRDELNEELDIEIASRKLNEETIRENNELKSDLESFINNSLSIINKTKSKTCPLCTQDYDSYKLLLDKITSNPLMSLEYNNLLTQKNTIQEKVDKIEEKLNKVNSDFKNKIQCKVSGKEFELDELKKGLSKQESTGYHYKYLYKN